MLSDFLSYFQFMRLLLLMLLIFFSRSPRFLFSHTVRTNVNSFRLQILFYLFARFLAICIALWNLNTKEKREIKTNKKDEETLEFLLIYGLPVFSFVCTVCV